MTDEAFLKPADYLDSDNAAVVEFAQAAIGDAKTQKEKAVRLYYAVREGIRYTPYLDFSAVESYRASNVLENGFGFCTSKASLLAACGRAVGVPSRVGFADVKNHLTTPRLLELNGSDLMRWHAFTEFYLEGKWVKATPAFNKELCERFRVKPLEFNGEEDSIFHPYDEDDRKHMEYINDHGTFADVPYDEIIATFRKHNPKLLGGELGGDFASEADAAH